MAPRPARLPNPKPTTINPKDSRCERGTTGGQFNREGGVRTALTEHPLRNQEVFYGKREQTDAGVSA